MENYIGKRLDGRYEIMEIIGVGGMAVVYKAYDNHDQKIVAVKILKNEFLANEEFKRKFKNESKAIALLSHENIVKVYDVSYGDVLQYIVMEYVDGITLKEYMKQQGRVDSREAIYFITQILRALQHAHDKGIVHRDVKPQNIMLQSDGTIKVTDFGIALFSRGETKTMSDSVMGSVHYISPEQAKGNVTDSKTDLYAVGVILYEMLTGSLPFQSDNAVSVALMQLQKEPTMPRVINPDIPVGLEQIIMRAMQKNVVDRYQSASEMLYDLDSYKHNPNIKFDYNFTTMSSQQAKPEDLSTPDETNRSNNKPAQRPASPANGARPVKRNPQPPKKAEDKSADYIDEKTKKRTIIILSSVLLSLIIFAGALFLIFGGNKNKLKVPQLEGLNFYTDVLNNSEYSDFEIVPQFKEDSELVKGTILDQDPKANKDIDRGGTIIVYIAGVAEENPIPDLKGKTFSEAEMQLKALGFKVEGPIMEKNDSVKVGTVLRTDPVSGTSVAAGSTVTIYIATNKNVTPVAVPNLLGMTVSEARAALNAVGLILDEDRSEYRASSSTKNTVVGYEKVGETVLPGTKIAVYISTGSEASNTTTTASTSATTTTTTTTTVTTTTRYTEAPTTEDTDITIFIPIEPTSNEERDTTVPTEAPTEPEPTEPEPTEPEPEPTEPPPTETPVVEPTEAVN